MNIKLTQKELIDLIIDVLTTVKFDSEGKEIGFYRLNGNTEIGEQDDGGGAGTSADGGGVGTAAMGAWESGVARGVANQIGVSIGNSGEKGTVRGKANPLW